VRIVPSFFSVITFPQVGQNPTAFMYFVAFMYFAAYSGILGCWLTPEHRSSDRGVNLVIAISLFLVVLV
jgi:hypothetical protein